MNMTDYETTFRTFRLQVPADYEFTRDVVEHWAAQHSGKLALVALDPRGEHRREITFARPRAGVAACRQRARGSRHHGRRAGIRDAASHPGVVRAAARHVPPRRDPDAGHDAVHGARHRPAHRARTGHGRSRRRRGGGQARDGPRRVRLAASRDRRRRRPLRTGTSATTACSPAPATRSRHHGRRAPTIRCSCTSPRAPWPRRRWCSTRTRRWEPGTRSRRASGRTSRPADLHWTFSDTGWAKAAWGKLFGQWRMGASRLPLGSARQARSGAVPAGRWSAPG